MKHKLLNNKKLIISMLPVVALMPSSVAIFSTTNHSYSTRNKKNPDVTMTLSGRDEDLFVETSDCRIVEAYILDKIKKEPSYTKYIPNDANVSLSKVAVVCDGVLYNVTTDRYLDNGNVVKNKQQFTVYVNGFQENPRYITVYDLLNKEVQVNDTKKEFTKQWYFYLIIAISSTVFLTALIILIAKTAKKKSNMKQAKMRAFGMVKESKKNKKYIATDSDYSK